MPATPSPKVSVIMPAFNGGRYIRASIQSVLDQTFADFELVVIDDGSTDDTAEVVRSFVDPRVRLLQNPQNAGLSRTRNRGIQEARGELLAWLDCDDLAPPQRLAKQVRFLEEHPACGMVGGWVKLIDRNGAPTGRRLIFNVPSNVIPALMLFRCAFQQSALTMRRSIIPDGLCYDEAFPPVEDFEFFVRLIRRAPGANLPEVLCSYRHHGMNASVRDAAVAVTGLRRLFHRQIGELGVTASETDIDLHLALGSLEARREIEPQAAHDWLARLLAGNQQTCVYESKAFAYVVVERWLYVCWGASGKAIDRMHRFFNAPLLRQAALPLTAYATLFARNVAKRALSGAG